jgi:preprotein translocase SecE subunit
MRQRSTFIGLFFFAAGCLTAFLLHLALASLFGVMRVNNTPILGDRFPLTALIGVVVGGGAAIGAFAAQRTKLLVGEVIDELNKVHWPSGEETRVNTGVVIVTSVVAAVILGVFDITFGQLSTMLADAHIRF